MNIEQIDKNLAPPEMKDIPDVEWHDIREAPFEIYGLYNPTEPGLFRRLPDEVASATNPGVKRLALNTAGGRVRFSTDSPYIAISVRFNHPDIVAKHMAHMPAVGKYGFDLYLDRGTHHHFITSFFPDVNKFDGFDTFRTVNGRDWCKGVCSYTIGFPLYNGVGNVMIGIKQGSTLGEGEKYRDVPPIVYYGSSITQGGCASRPGNSYQGFICRRNNIDYINLGFSGSACGEVAMAEYIAGLDMSVFVCDYDHNAPNPAHLRDTYERFYHIIRDKRPDLPYVMVSKPDVDGREKDGEARKKIIIDAYDRARAAGDRNVYFIDGETLFEGDCREDCTVDGTHPNDLGFYRMGRVIGDLLEKLI